MQKLLSYTTFAFTTLFILMVFFTAANYYQLGLAMLFYPVLAYFALKLFPRKKHKYKLTPAVAHAHKKVLPLDTAQKLTQAETVNLNIASVDISDINKRAFLKLIGAAGAYFFLFSLFSRRGEDLLYGRAANLPAFLGGGNPITQPPLNPASTEGYHISEIDDSGEISYFGYINTYGEWYIMKGGLNSGSFRYTRGDKKFPQNWDNREYLDYDYFYNLFE